MISNDRFLDLVSSIGRELREPDNSAQYSAITHAENAVLQIVAGPGSGKTSVLVLRALRYVFMDGILSENILLTTFTRKAAKELRTRWLDWGGAILRKLNSSEKLHLGHIDLNRCQIDTLDSIIEQTLTEYRLPGTLAPVVAETSASNLIFRRTAFRQVYESNKDIIDDLLSRYTFENQIPSNRGEALRTTKRLIERLVQDRVDLDSYAKSGHAQELITEMLECFRRQVYDRNVFDFSLLEESFLNRLINGSLDEWLTKLQVILIDEYQDTNPLQEAIYFSLLQKADLAATIVGDDDQSMYRFRGGSVELFTDFAKRCQRMTGRETNRIDMVRNFRSTPEIVRFYNHHITLDHGFTTARVNPPKPQVTAVRPSGGTPVLGMFRPSEESLAEALAVFLHKLVGRRVVRVGDTNQEIRMSQEGNLGDIVFLSHSVEETTYQRYNGTVEQRFPGLLRREIESKGMNVFNPRGQALRSIHNVEVLLGLMLLAVDSNGTLIDEVYPTNEARFFLNQWRIKARKFIDSNPPPNDDQGLCGFIQSWQHAAQGLATKEFPIDWPVLEIVFKLITWMPDFQQESEHQVWLEGITRIIASASMASAYSMHLFQNTEKTNNGEHVRISRMRFIADALIPIAEAQVDVDEDIIPSIPRDRLQFMTVHQAKGLEFPLVVVNVGSRFTRNHSKQRFLRFPDDVSNVVQAEDDVELHLPAPLRKEREALDRTFDDLVRLYYVAYSRPQSVLLLVGHENCLRYGTGKNYTSRSIPNIALGWRRDETWTWRQSFTGRRAPVKVEPPFLEI